MPCLTQQATVSWKSQPGLELSHGYGVRLMLRPVIWRACGFVLQLHGLVVLYALPSFPACGVLDGVGAALVHEYVMLIVPTAQLPLLC